MAVAWLLWPFVVLFAVLIRALWRVLCLWYITILTGIVGCIVGFGLTFVALIVDGLAVRWSHKPDGSDFNPNNWVAFELHWWHWLHPLGAARLLSSGWTSLRPGPQSYPTNHDLRMGLVHISLAGGLALASLCVLLFFLGVIMASYLEASRPNRGRIAV